MSAGAPWSVKGIDPKAREVAKDLARRSGMTLGEWLNRVILDDDLPEEVTTESQFAERGRRAAHDGPRLTPVPTSPDMARIAYALDRVTDRIEASETRTGLAITGVEHAIRQALARIETAEREQLAVTNRLEGALAEASAEQSYFGERLRRVEEATGPRSAEAIRALEGRLARAEPESVVETVLTRLGERVGQAEARTAVALEELKVSLSALDQRVWGVERGATDHAEQKFEALAQVLTHRVEQVRAEVAQKLAEAGGGAHVEQRLAEMAEHVRAAELRSSQAVEEIGRQVLSMAEAVGKKLEAVDQRGAEAIDQIGTEVARIAGAVELRLARGEHTQAEAFERLTAEFTRATQGLTDRLSASETRAGPAVEAAHDRAVGDAAPLDDAHHSLGPPPEPEPEPADAAAFGPDLFLRAEPEPEAETITAEWRKLDLDVPGPEVPETFAPIAEADDDDIFAPDPSHAVAAARDDPPPVRGPQLSTREVIDKARAAARAARGQDAPPIPEMRAKVQPRATTGRLFQGFGAALAGRPRRAQNTALQTALMVAGGAAFLSVGAAGITLMQGPGAANPETAVAPFGANPRAAVALTPGLAPAPTSLAPPVFVQVKAEVEQGVPGALQRLRGLADAGNAQAQLYLGQLYDAGEAGLSRDPEEARRLTSLAAESGDAAAMHNLGVYYFRGEGGPADFTLAAQWFKRAAAAGVVESQYNLGLLYQSGSGVPKDLAEARRWFRQAADHGDAEARRALADLAPAQSAQSQAAQAAPRPPPHPAARGPAAAPRPAAEAAASPNVKQAQAILARLGYYEGPADGRANEAYKVALFRYQRDQTAGPKPYAPQPAAQPPATPTAVAQR